MNIKIINAYDSGDGIGSIERVLNFPDTYTSKPRELLDTQVEEIVWKFFHSYDILPDCYELDLVHVVKSSYSVSVIYRLKLKRDQSSWSNDVGTMLIELDSID